MKRKLMVKSLILGFLLSVVLGGISLAEAQRGQHMMRGQPDQPYDAREDLNGFQGMGMMGPGMMGPGMGMMGPGMMGPGMGMIGPDKHMQGLLDYLQLTDEQREEVRSIQRKVRREHMEAMLDVMELREDMWAAFREQRPDPENMRQMHEAMSEKKGDMLVSFIEM
ncbi:periplasmic heavy metal sensor, partial [Desulfonatronospira sp.]|uniref:periplasmic heavy metal sensor n=1 Tax=Desulfonatronospira sp. TaxID=1962951 RepID=UPI0025C50272